MLIPTIKSYLLLFFPERYIQFKIELKGKLFFKPNFLEMFFGFCIDGYFFFVFYN